MAAEGRGPDGADRSRGPAGLDGSAPAIPPLLPGQPPIAILVDYDGTIALTDVSDTITLTFLSAELEADLNERYRTGRIGSRDVMELEAGLMPADHPAIEAILDLVAAQPHDPAFAPFVRRARAAGIPVEIVSDGFGFFIGPAMERLGIRDDVAIATALTTFDGDRANIEFPNGHPTCRVCGTCKRNRVFAHRAAGRAVVFVGDGESDRYAAGYSDFVFAKRGLLRICEGYGWPHMGWHDFNDVDAWLVRALDAWGATGQALVQPAEHPIFCGPEVWGEFRTRPPRPFEIVGGETAPPGTGGASVPGREPHP